MKFLYSIALFAISALAQRAQIGLPTEGQDVTAGKEIVVQIQRPNSLSGSTEIGVVIGFTSCVDAPCHTAEDVLGKVLYNGPFKPVYHESNLPPYENFSVTVPESAAKGKGQINVAHATLIGAGPSAFLESFNRTVTVA
ncbi:unnamed protein product [Penicillium salamii]|nr:unnamed protein product [Penicillium salamii]CAG8678536.1 unnamed protein product [Penicillium salamii]